MSQSAQKPVPSKYKVPALEKGLDILEELARSPRPQSLTQLANNLGRSSNEIYRMVNYLEWRGYIRREPHSSNYYLSLKLYELAHLNPPLQNLLNAATIPMEQLAITLRESCHLGVLRHGQLVVVKQALSPEKICLSVEVGGRFSAVHTASGRLLLAYLAQEELEAFLELDQDYQRLSPPEKEAFLVRLEEIRTKGYSDAESETHVGINDLSVLVGNPKIGLTAALTVASLTFAKSAPAKKEILHALQECAAKISKSMGIKNGDKDDIL
ncbi:MAG: IclR family transcriptional regulator [Chloroflexi bacterium]|nr:MAG: IclR family transcriptional regulator [Chloroflexota bacterium]